MGILGSLFGGRPQVSQAAFSVVMPRLVSKLELVREQFVFGGVTALKSEGVPVGDTSPLLEKGSELDAALKGFQLTTIMGFAWNYTQLVDRLPFDRQLTRTVDSNDGDMTSHYRERYLDCRGNIDLLSSSLAEDIHRIWGSPEPASKFKRGLASAAITLGIVSQATTASAFGDTKTEKNSRASCAFDGGNREVANAAPAQRTGYSAARFGRLVRRAVSRREESIDGLAYPSKSQLCA